MALKCCQQINHNQQEEHAQRDAKGDHLATALGIGDLDHARIVDSLGEVDLRRADEHAAGLYRLVRSSCQSPALWDKELQLPSLSPAEQLCITFKDRVVRYIRRDCIRIQSYPHFPQLFRSFHYKLVNA